jgi:TrmH family RNA methyltransferase
MESNLQITSLQNARVKQVVKLRQRSHRDKLGLMIIEGYREIRRAVDNSHTISELFVCPSRFQGENNEALIDEVRGKGGGILECDEPVFDKISYRDRPDGLLAVAPQVSRSLDELTVPDCPLIVVAEAIEKPGNLGTILRSADGVGADAVIVCDRCTDLNNPNVVRASVGTLFSVPVVEAGTAETLEWVRGKGIRIVAATPHAEKLYTEADLSGATAVVVGTEQYGLSQTWLTEADIEVRIPMRGQADSLNVASATTILLYEALRQRKHE